MGKDTGNAGLVAKGCRSTDTDLVFYDDHPYVEKLLKLNEILNSVIEQYDEVKSGNLVKVALPSEEEDETNSSYSHGRQVTPKQKSKETSLIDFIDDGSDGSNSSSSTPKTTG